MILAAKVKVKLLGRYLKLADKILFVDLFTIVVLDVSEILCARSV
jgi:hypothetical protein